MQLTLKLFSNLMEYLPASAEGNKVRIDSPAGTSCNDLIAHYSIPPDEVQVIMVNGDHLPQERRDEPLNEGDKITIWPSIQGG